MPNPALALALPLALSCPATPIAAPSAPPPGRVAFQSYGAAEGLSDLADNAVVQDAAGYLWVATQSGGVFRYDGAGFVGYGREEGLPSANVVTIVAAAGGGVWVGTFDGIAHGDGRRFEVPPAGSGAPSGPINALAIDRDGHLWVGAVAGYFRQQGERFERAGDADVSALFADQDGAMILAEGSTLRRIERGQITRSWTMADGLPAARITSIARDGAGRLWVRSKTALHLLGDDGRFLDRGCLLPARTHDGPMSVDRRGRLLVPTSSGLLRIDRDHAEVLDAARGLPTPFATHAFEDREGSLWVASAGLHKLLGRGLWSSYGEAEGLPSAIVWAIARAPDGALFVGTESGLARATTGGFELVPGTRDRTFGAIAFGPDGALYSTGSAAGLTRIDPRTSVMTSLAAGAGLTLADITLQLAIDGAGRFWVTTRRDGLFRGEITSGALRFAPFPLPRGGPTERVNHVVSGSDGRVWFAGSDGLAMLDGEGVRRFTTSDGLLENRIATIALRPSGETCVSYRGHGGATCFRVTGADLTGAHHLDLQQERRAIQFLGEDARHRMWAGSTRGVTITDERGTEPFGIASGAPGDDCAELAFLAEASGDVWMGTSTGLGRFDAATYGGPPSPPDAVLVEADVGQQRVTSFTDSLVVPHRDASLRARFSALSFLDEKRVAYETRLVGADDEFRPSRITQAQYAALPPGSYRFEVRARVDRGAPGHVAHLSFSVLPAWWQTWWLRSLVAVVAWLTIALGVRWRLRAALARNLELERLVEQRTQELGRAHAKVAEAEKLAGLGRVLAQLSHELNNPTNVIWNNLEPIRGYVGDLQKALAETRELASSSPDGRARVEALWSELDLDFVSGDIGEALAVVRTAAQRVKSVHADLRTFMRGGEAELVVGDLLPSLRETVAMVRRGMPAGVTLEERYGPLPDVRFHAGQLSQVVHNLLQNALDAVSASGVITLETRTQDGAAEIVVSDDGPGIAEAIRTRIFEPFFTTKDVGKGTGLGLAICRQIVVENHGGSLSLDETRAGGARFVVRLPAASAG